jgi:RecA/RadA recombinase
MITDELKKLDDILTNGISSGTITDIFGFRGTGKTHMVLQVSLDLLKNGKNVLFVDTTSEFRPERLLEIVKNRSLDDSLLNKLQIARVTNTKEQIELIKKIKKIDDISLLIVDNVADLFSFEYSKIEQFNLQQQKFMNYMHDLSELAIQRKIPIIITNQLMKANNIEYEKLNYSISNYTHQKIKLEKQKDHYLGTVSSPSSPKTQFFYKIEKTGLVETS